MEGGVGKKKEAPLGGPTSRDLATILSLAQNLMSTGSSSNSPSPAQTEGASQSSVFPRPSIASLPKGMPVWVTCDIAGGLGNQLFQIATGLAVCERVRKIAGESSKSAKSDSTGSIVQFVAPREPWSRTLGGKRKVYWNSCFSKVQTLPPEEIKEAKDECEYIASWSEMGFPFVPINVKCKPNASAQEKAGKADQNHSRRCVINLSGYFQSWKYFDFIRSKFVELFLFSESHYSPTAKVPRKEGSVKLQTVSVHIRTYIEPDGSFAPEKIHARLSPDYYLKAMTRFDADTHNFLVFTDDIKLAKEKYHERVFSCFPHVTYINDELEAEDLEEFSMMRKCNHHIIANSSFSWWAAYLHHEEAGRKPLIIAPSRWFGPKGSLSMIIIAVVFYFSRLALLAFIFSGPSIVLSDLIPPWFDLIHV